MTRISLAFHPPRPLNPPAAYPKRGRCGWAGLVKLRIRIDIARAALELVAACGMTPEQICADTLELLGK
jgi:hypothetical protein